MVRTAAKKITLLDINYVFFSLYFSAIVFSVVCVFLVTYWFYGLIIYFLELFFLFKTWTKASGDSPRDKSLGSETMAVNGNDRNDRTLKGDAAEKNIESIVFSMQKQMTENQKTMLTLTQTMQ